MYELLKREKYEIMQFAPSINLAIYECEVGW